MVKAIVRAERWCLDNTAEAARILSKDGEGYLPFSADIVQRVAKVGTIDWAGVSEWA